MATSSTSATPFLAAIDSKSIVAHILGRCEIPEEGGRCEIPEEAVAHKITHWDLYRHFARFDRANFPRGWWRVTHLLRTWWYAMVRNASLRVWSHVELRSLRGHLRRPPAPRRRPP